MYISLPRDVAKIRTDDKHRGFIFVFGSAGVARKWKKNTPLWREYLKAEGELYIELCMTERESNHVAALIKERDKKEEEREERETEELERMRIKELAERERRRREAAGVRAYYGHGHGHGLHRPVEAKNSGFGKHVRW